MILTVDLLEEQFTTDRAIQYEFGLVKSGVPSFFTMKLIQCYFSAGQKVKRTSQASETWLIFAPSSREMSRV